MQPKRTARDVLNWLERVQREANELADNLDPKRRHKNDLAARIDRVGAVAYQEAGTVRVLAEREEGDT